MLPQTPQLEVRAYQPRRLLLGERTPLFPIPSDRHTLSFYPQKQTITRPTNTAHGPQCRAGVLVQSVLSRPGCIAIIRQWLLGVEPPPGHVSHGTCIAGSASRAGEAYPSPFDARDGAPPQTLHSTRHRSLYFTEQRPQGGCTLTGLEGCGEGRCWL